MQHHKNSFLIFAGSVAVIGALLHLAMIVGGPDWYRFFGAPEAIVQMAAAGDLYPVLVCVFIASVLLVWAAYAFSGAGLIRRLPLLRTVLVLVAVVLMVRGLAFVPVMLWRPELLARICNCQGVDGFLLTTSALCLLTGLAFALGARRVW